MVSDRENRNAFNAMDLNIRSAHTQWVQRHQSMNIAPQITFCSRCCDGVERCYFAVILFLAAHFALLVGVTTPDKFYFDEVHYVPAARQMLEPAPLGVAAQSNASATGKAIDRAVDPQLWRHAAGLALSGRAVRIAGDRRDVSLRSSHCFAAQGPAVASALLAFFNQMVFVQSRIAMLDIFCIGVWACSQSRRFLHGFPQAAAAALVLP